ncbi:transglycosylase SLT domain-containing protein [Paraburkholderia sp. B3]|uniref:lytic transglycosylase domain-containing protein n=1 Tax=Paraburkholderia sp. B3 TaxID=3134791 RepID=UPI003982A3C2
MDDAAAFQHVNVNLMRGIAQVESGMKPDRINTNSNGTTDIGLMQINSSWLPVLAREGISEQSLFDPCTNAYVGAWILSENIRQFGPTWNAVGAYNAASPDKRLVYARKVYDAVQSISGSSDSSMPILPPSFTPPQAYNPFASLEINSVQPARGGASSGMPPGIPTPGGASGSAVASSAAYNFGWTVTGADQAKPIQVFDDGSKVFVQFTDMKHVPAIFGETPTGSRVLLRWDLQFPYAVIARPEKTLVFQMGTYEARAQRTPGSVAQGSGQSGSAPASGPAANNATANAMAHATAAMPASAASPVAVSKERVSSATDALWYATQSTSKSAAPQATPLPTTPVQPVASPPAQEKATTKSSPGTDALWYITK